MHTLFLHRDGLPYSFIIADFDFGIYSLPVLGGKKIIPIFKDPAAGYRNQKVWEAGRTEIKITTQKHWRWWDCALESDHG